MSRERWWFGLMLADLFVSGGNLGAQNWAVGAGVLISTGLAAWMWQAEKRSSTT